MISCSVTTGRSIKPAECTKTEFRTIYVYQLTLMHSLILLLEFCFCGLLSHEDRGALEAFISVAKHHLINTQLRRNQPHQKLVFISRDENSWKCLHYLQQKWWHWQLCGRNPQSPRERDDPELPWVRLCMGLVISLHWSGFWGEDLSRAFKMSGLFIVTSSKEQEQAGSASSGEEMASLSVGIWSSR